MFSISHTQMETAKASPDDFRDGIIVARATGFATVELLNGELIFLRVFESPADCDLFGLHEPVAYHPQAEVLAIRDSWITVKLYQD